MTDVRWAASVTVRPGSAALAERLLRALGPEAAREVPRARATLHCPSPETLRIDVEAADSGALRAAMNTYLGWVQLALAAADAARPTA